MPNRGKFGVLKSSLFSLILGGGGLFLFLLYVSMGAVKLPLSESAATVWNLLVHGEQYARTEYPRATAILLHIRLPRALAGILAGAALGIAGAAMQGLFRNPMASPDIMGITAGSSFGAVIAIGTGLVSWSLWVLPLFSTLGAWITAAFVYMLAGRQRLNLMFVILAGMAVSSLLNGAVSAILLFSQEYEVAQFIFWTMGGLEGRMWKHLLFPLPVIAISLVALWRLAPALNALSLGEENAFGMGLAVNRVKMALLFWVAVMTAMAISLAGPIAFVGLMVPHIIRLLIGPDHRVLLPLSAYVGAMLVILADWFGRIIIAPHEIKVGIITAILGGSYFVFLILRLQRQGRLL